MKLITIEIDVKTNEQAYSLIEKLVKDNRVISFEIQTIEE